MFPILADEGVAIDDALDGAMLSVSPICFLSPAGESQCEYDEEPGSEADRIPPGSMPRHPDRDSDCEADIIGRPPLFAADEPSSGCPLTQGGPGLASDRLGQFFCVLDIELGNIEVLLTPDHPTLSSLLEIGIMQLAE